MQIPAKKEYVWFMLSCCLGILLTPECGRFTVTGAVANAWQRCSSELLGVQGRQAAKLSHFSIARTWYIRKVVHEILRGNRNDKQPVAQKFQQEFVWGTGALSYLGVAWPSITKTRTTRWYTNTLVLFELGLTLASALVVAALFTNPFGKRMKVEDPFGETQERKVNESKAVQREFRSVKADVSPLKENLVRHVEMELQRKGISNAELVLGNRRADR